MPPLTDAMKREIGQHFVFGFHGYEVNEDIRALICDYHLGSVILMKRNVRDAEQVRNLVKNLQGLAKEFGHEKPLLIGIDQENGLVSAFSSPSAGTQFPGAMALAATGSTDLAYKVSLATGQELKMLGINWVYSPVADVNSDPRNPVIGVRSFGNNPAQVSSFVSAVARGLADAGVAPTAKHFPGHGDTHVDSHLALPRIVKTKEQLQKTELIPFTAVFGETTPIASVMTGHMALPLLTGSDVPASLSVQLTEEFLRGKLGYEGVVVTDCLEMEAVASTYNVAEAAVMALEAKADIVMVCHRFNRHVASIKRVYDAFESGRLNLNELKTSNERIRFMKDTFTGNWEDVLGQEDNAIFWEQWGTLKKENSIISQKAYRESCTVVWGSEVLPLVLDAGKKVILLTPRMESISPVVNTAGAEYLSLVHQVQARMKCDHVVYSSGEPNLADYISADVGAVVFVLCNADQKEWQKEAMRKVLQTTNHIPTVLLSSCGPYDLDGEDIRRAGTAYLKCYEFTLAAFEAVVEKIL